MTAISGKSDPVVRGITPADVAEALGQGLRDFQAAPLFGLFFGAIFAAGGLAIVAFTAGFGWSYLAYPLAAGFTLIGPFAAAGLYEVSRRRESGLPRRVLPCPGGEHLPQDDFADIAGRHACTFERRRNRDRTEIVSRHRSERSHELADGGARGADEIDVAVGPGIGLAHQQLLLVGYRG